MNALESHGLSGVEPEHLLGKGLASVAQQVDLVQTNRPVGVAVQLLEDNLGHVFRLLLRDAVLHYAHDVVVADPELLVEPCEQQFDVVDDGLLEDGLVDPAVHLDEALEVQLLLVGEDALQYLWPYCDLDGVQNGLEAALEAAELTLGVAHEGVVHGVEAVEFEAREVVLLLQVQDVVAQQIALVLQVVLQKDALQFL